MQIKIHFYKKNCGISIAMKTGNRLVCIKLQVRKLSIAKYSDYYNNLHNAICKN